MLYLLLAALKLSIELCENLVGQHRRFAAVVRFATFKVKVEGTRATGTLARTRWHVHRPAGALGLLFAITTTRCPAKMLLRTSFAVTHYNSQWDDFAILFGKSSHGPLTGCACNVTYSLATKSPRVRLVSATTPVTADSPALALNCPTKGELILSPQPKTCIRPSMTVTAT